MQCVSADSTTCFGGTGTENILSEDVIKIFPNAARDWISVSGRNVQSVKIIDLQGRFLDEFAFTDSSRLINVSNLPSGIYFLAVRQSKNVIYQKLIIQK